MTNTSLICYFQTLSVKGQTGIKLHQNLFPDVKCSLISSVMSILLISIERSVNLVFLDRCQQMVERGKYFKNCFYFLQKFSSFTIGSFRGTGYDIVQISFRNIFLCEKAFFFFDKLHCSGHSAFISKDRFWCFKFLVMIILSKCCLNQKKQIYLLDLVYSSAMSLVM